MTDLSVGRESQLLTARIDRIGRATRSQRRWGVLLAGTFLFELADLNTFGLVAPTVQAQWHLSLSAVGWVTSLAFLGMFVGSFVGGRLSDRYGRKWTLIGMTAFFSVFSLLSATAGNVTSLGAYRILTGAGLTGMTVIALTYVSEMYPAAVRGRYLSWIFGAGLLGLPAISWFARWVVPMGANGWRLVFIVGALGLVLAAAMVAALPESVRWLAQRGDTARAEVLVLRLEREAMEEGDGTLPDVVVNAPRPVGRVRDLLGGAYRMRTIVYVLTVTFALLGFYGYQALLPTLLVEHGFDTVKSLTYTSIVQVGAIPGALLAYPIVDRWQRKYLIGVLYVTIAALAVVYGYADGSAMILTSGFLIAMLLQTASVAMYAYGPEIFPTELRGLGSGAGNGIGRLATFGGANLLPQLYITWGYASVFVYVAAVLVVAAGLMAFLGEQTSGRSLEKLGEPHAEPAADAGLDVAPAPSVGVPRPGQE
jgi:putative MFS transporter